MATNSELISGLYAAFARGDVPSVLGALQPDIQWTEAAGFPYAGTYVGPPAVLQGVFMRLGADWDGFAAVCQQTVAEGDTVVALGEYSGTYKATGKFMKVPFAHVWRMRDGKAAKFWQHTDTAVVQRALS